MHDFDSTDSTQNRLMPVSEVRQADAEYADCVHRFEVLNRVATSPYRRNRFDDVEGRVVDVPCDIGTDVRYLPETVDLNGADISSETLANAQHLDLPDDNFIAVRPFSTPFHYVLVDK